VDVNLETLSIDLTAAQNLVSKDKNIRAIFSIHPLGYAIDPITLNKFCDQNNLIQINDVCESLGSWRDKVHAGTTGIASSFSFYFSHHITTMEGGGVATNQLNIADDVRAIRSHGWSRDRSDVEKWNKRNNANLLTQNISKNQLKFQFITTGYNIRPLEIQAAIGIEQLKDLDSFILRRRSIAKFVNSKLENSLFEVIHGGSLANIESEKFHSWMLIPIKINKKLSTNDRKKIDELLEKFEIESRPVLTGNFLNQPAMQKINNLPTPDNFPNAQLISSNYFMVGAHHDLTDEQINYLGDSLKLIAESI
jgi:CDP-6-deoxy-D-xylo-4-hexulose-3-dehydrase